MIKSILAALLLFSNLAFGEAFSCIGIPKEIKVWKSTGYVAVKLNTYNKVLMICKVDTDAGCNATMSLLQAAKVTGSEVGLRLYGNSFTDCDSLPSWTPSLTDEIDYVTSY